MAIIADVFDIQTKPRDKDAVGNVHQPLGKTPLATGLTDNAATMKRDILAWSPPVRVFMMKALVLASPLDPVADEAVMMDET